MTTYESSIKQVYAPQGAVYAKLSDLTHLSVIKERMDDPAFASAVAAQVPADKLEQLRKDSRLQLTEEPAVLDALDRSRMSDDDSRVIVQPPCSADLIDESAIRYAAFCPCRLLPGCPRR